MPLTIGEKLGPYEIVEHLGAGGMGEVYRGNDPRLHRSVAIKISAEQFNERAEQEARAVAALNHPNVCTLYDIGPNYLVMELSRAKRWRIGLRRVRFRWRRRSISPGRLPMRLGPLMNAGSFTAISSRPISRFGPMARSRFWISDWPRWGIRSRSARIHRP
jgi:hypothetical protein